MFKVLVQKKETSFGDVVRLFTLHKEDGTKSYQVEVESCGIASRKNFTRASDALAIYQIAA